MVATVRKSVTSSVSQSGDSVIPSPQSHPAPTPCISQASLPLASIDASPVASPPGRNFATYEPFLPDRDALYVFCITLFSTPSQYYTISRKQSRKRPTRGSNYRRTMTTTSWSDFRIDIVVRNEREARANVFMLERFMFSLRQQFAYRTFISTRDQTLQSSRGGGAEVPFSDNLTRARSIIAQRFVTISGVRVRVNTARNPRSHAPLEVVTG